jgi:hypothetical protein
VAKVAHACPRCPRRLSRVPYPQQACVAPPHGKAAPPGALTRDTEPPQRAVTSPRRCSRPVDAALAPVTSGRPWNAPVLSNLAHSHGAVPISSVRRHPHRNRGARYINECPGAFQPRHSPPPHSNWSQATAAPAGRAPGRGSHRSPAVKSPPWLDLFGPSPARLTSPLTSPFSSGSNEMLAMANRAETPDADELLRRQKVEKNPASPFRRRSAPFRYALDRRTRLHRTM